MIGMFGMEASLFDRTRGISVYFLVDSRDENRVMCHPPSC